MTSNNEGGRKMNDPDQHTDTRSAADVGLDAHLQAHIGSQLKSMYDSYLNAPVPDRIVELLEQLDEVSRGSGTAGDEKAGDRGSDT